MFYSSDCKQNRRTYNNENPRHEKRKKLFIYFNKDISIYISLADLCESEKCRRFVQFRVRRKKFFLYI